jgi:hypothetical protein
MMTPPSCKPISMMMTRGNRVQIYPGRAENRGEVSQRVEVKLAIIIKIISMHPFQSSTGVVKSRLPSGFAPYILFSPLLVGAMLCGLSSHFYVAVYNTNIPSSK